MYTMRYRLTNPKSRLYYRHLSFIFIDCIHGLFKETMLAENVSCTVPWIQSMHGISRSNTTAVKLPTCNTLEAYRPVDFIGYYYAQNASVYSHPKCPGNYY